MSITITGSKYSGTVSSYLSNTLTITGASFSANDFLPPNKRVVAIFNSSNEFKAIAYVRQAPSATTLQLEYNPFDPITQEDVAIISGDVFNVSLNFSELATTGLIVNVFDYEDQTWTVTRDYTYLAGVWQTKSINITKV